jgi:hypothetical protein
VTVIGTHLYSASTISPKRLSSIASPEPGAGHPAVWSSTRKVVAAVTSVPEAPWSRMRSTSSLKKTLVSGRGGRGSTTFFFLLAFGGFELFDFAAAAARLAAFCFAAAASDLTGAGGSRLASSSEEVQAARGRRVPRRRRPEREIEGGLRERKTVREGREPIDADVGGDGGEKAPRIEGCFAPSFSKAQTPLVSRRRLLAPRVVDHDGKS